MAIDIVTGGPTGELPDDITPFSPTFGELVNAIADDIDDTTGEYTGQIQNAIKAAIRYCERTPFYFNETVDETFLTTAGTDQYVGFSNGNISTLAGLTAVYCEDTNGQRRTLMRMSQEEIEILSDNSAAVGEPYAFSYFSQRFQLYPIPDKAYTIRLQLSPYRLTPITSSTETNAWLSEAYDMVKARAKYVLAKDTLKDANMASEALNDFGDQFLELKAETSRRSSSGYIIATCF